MRTYNRTYYREVNGLEMAITMVNDIWEITHKGSDEVFSYPVKDFKMKKAFTLHAELYADTVKKPAMSQSQEAKEVAKAKAKKAKEVAKAKVALLAGRANAMKAARLAATKAYRAAKRA